MEFQSTGFDASIKNDYPDKPSMKSHQNGEATLISVIFTKRATSITGHNTEIYPHPNVTDSLDYEGELGIIIGKPGIGIAKEDAWSHVWGAVIINDVGSHSVVAAQDTEPSQVSARDRQRDHKQFYIGKSLDTFCPMGPFAVHCASSVLSPL